MGAYRELEGDAPPWAQQIYSELCELRAKQEAMDNSKSLTVDVVEAAQMLGLHPVTLRQKARNGEMPKTCSKQGEQRKWNRKDIEKMAESKKFGGRPRNV